MSLYCVMGINGLFMGSSVCMQRGRTLEANLPEIYIDGECLEEAASRIVAQGVKTCICLRFFCGNSEGHFLS